MKTILKKIPEGGFFRLSESETAALWVRGYYERSVKKFECYKYDNVNHESFMRGTREVFPA